MWGATNDIASIRLTWILIKTFLGTKTAMCVAVTPEFKVKTL
jgi:hypothetical protein